MYYIIVNPASKSGKGKKIWKSVETVLNQKEVSYKVLFSQKSGHVSRLIKELSVTCAPSAENPLKLIVLGGDGTFNEALQGVSDFEHTLIGYIPTGSSNDMARDLKLTKEPVKAITRILSCREPVKMDLGSLSFHTVSDEFSRIHSDEFSPKRYFAVSSGIGFDAAVCEEALSSGFKNTLNRIGLGKLTYLIIALKQLITAKKVPCELFLDNEPPIRMSRFLFIASMIHQYEGGGFRFCPDADFHDGILDICTIGDLSKWLILLALPTAFKGKHYRFKGIDRYYAKTIRIHTSAPLWVHTDGEVSVKATDITAACEKDKLRMLL